MRTAASSVVLWSLLCLVACNQAVVATPAPTTIVIAGASTLQPVLLDLTTAFSEMHPNVVFSLRGGGSTIGLQRVQSGAVDLAASTQLPSDVGAEIGAEAAPADSLVAVPVGLDGVAIVVHHSNEASGLSLEQLRDIFSGRILEWSAVLPAQASQDASPSAASSGAAPSEPQDIVLVSREDGSGTRIRFESRVMKDDPVSLTAVVMPTSADVVEFVEGNPNAIGYVTRAYVVDQLSSVGDEAQPDADPHAEAVRVLPIEGILPTLDHLADQSYSITQPLYLVSRGRPQGWMRQFIDFVLSPAGQEIVGKYHLRVR